MVILISLTVLIFSYAYINSLIIKNFLLLYFIFIFRIVWLILNNNFYWIILGWDGLGVVSFLLIVFYINYERVNNGLFTLFQNRIGDVFFVSFILGVFSLLITNTLFLTVGLLFLIIGRRVKRAQFPFNAWLLSAIRAPTPISSLVHSSTLVVAGVFILLQYSYCLVELLSLLKYIRLLRLVLSTFGLINERDMKKLIAYSTMSHVSLIIYILRFKLFKIVYFHLNIHAIFKSLIFICFGFLILMSYHAQDKRLVSLVNITPLVKIIYYFSCFCLIGLPFLRGFFSKDLMIEKLIRNSLEISYIFFLLMFLSVRIYYSVKLISLIKFNYSIIIIEKNFIRFWSVLLIVIIMSLLINMHLSLVFSLSLEFFSFKILIYAFIICFFLLSVLTNLNYKIVIYEKKQNIQEIWKINYYGLDAYIYWNISLLIGYVSILSKFKLILLMNWWVIIRIVFIFYNKSLIV